jgi:hypothetical protein
MLLQRDRIIDKIRFPKPHGQNAASNNRAPQTARYSFDFRKFWHEGIANKITHPLAARRPATRTPSTRRSALALAGHFFW